MAEIKDYKAKQFDLSGLNGISDQTLEMHFKLYEGYVTNTNTLTRKITEILSDGKVDQEEVPAYSELTRRLGFEYNGMVLHEWYFGNMKKGSTTTDPEQNSNFRRLPRRPSAATTSGRRTSSASARCAGWAGRSAIRTRSTSACRTTGSRCTRSATSPALSPSS